MIDLFSFDGMIILYIGGVNKSFDYGNLRNFLNRSQAKFLAESEKSIINKMNNIS